MDDPGTEARKRAAKTGLRCGIGGWTYAPWRNHFYPASLKQKDELAYASRHVTTIEINGTFYRAQTAATYAKWRKDTPAGFVFSLKTPGHIAGRRVLADTGKAIDAFVFGGLAELEDRLGPLLWQLPEGKVFDRPDLAAFLDQLPRDLDGMPLRHVLEVRHESFRCADYIALARKYNVPTVFTDSDEHPSFADLTGDFVYARLMRSESRVATGYAPAALDAWATRMQQWAAGGRPDDLPYVDARPAAKTPRAAFVNFISAAKEQNPSAAMALIERLAR